MDFEFEKNKLFCDWQKIKSKIDFEDSATHKYEEYVRPLIGRLLSQMKMDYSYHRGEGENLFTHLKNPNMEITSQEVIIKDFLGGYGSLLFGHNYSLFVDALKLGLNRQVPFQSQASIRPISSQVAESLNELLKNEREELNLEANPKYISTFTNSGAESVEAAIKLTLTLWIEKKLKIKHLIAEKYAASLGANEVDNLDTFMGELEKSAQLIQPIFIALKRGFHGKTSGAVALTANEEYSQMFERLALKVIFVDPDKLNNKEELEKDLLQKIPQFAKTFAQFGLSPIAAFIYEPVQAEGGIFPLDTNSLQSIKEVSQKFKFPIIADEIQSGWMRCGWILYSHACNVVPDIILLGKSLGGGLVKSGVMLASTEFYDDNFGFKHTSTFAEDELSAQVVLAVCDEIEIKKEFIQKKARDFELKITKMIQALQIKYPGIIAAVRGRGLLMGIEFNAVSDRYPFILQALFNSGYGTYFLSSFLLNCHQLRLGVTLSSPMTLRIEPCFNVSELAVTKLSEGLADLIECLYESKTGRLTSYLWQEGQKSHNHISSQIKKIIPNNGETPVCFLGHLIGESAILRVDNLFQSLSGHDIKKIVELSEL